jgi:hypothetical protein
MYAIVNVSSCLQLLVGKSVLKHPVEGSSIGTLQNHLLFEEAIGVVGYLEEAIDTGKLSKSRSL